MSLFDMFGFQKASLPSRVCDCEDPASSILITDEVSGDVICMGCGIVRDVVISEEAEYRLFSDDVDSASRQRVEVVDERFTLSTTISDTGKNNCTLGKTQGRIGKSYQEKKILDGFSIIQQYCTVLNVPTFVLDEAKNLHFEMGEKRQKHTRGCWTEPMYAATVLIAAKRAQFGITFKEVSRVLNIPEKSIRKTYAQLIKMLGFRAAEQQQQGTEEEGKNNNNVHPGRTNPSLLTNQYGAKLKLPYKVILTTNSVAYMALPFLEGKKPSTVAAAAILVVVRNQNSAITEAEIASAAGISPVTLRSAYNCLVPHLPVLMPNGVQAN